MSTIGPTPVHEALEGLAYPATKEQILAHIDGGSSEKGALIRSKVADIPDGDYASVDEIDQAMGDESY